LGVFRIALKSQLFSHRITICLPVGQTCGDKIDQSGPWQIPPWAEERFYSRDGQQPVIIQNI